jgi:hypothetical protein
MKGLQQEGAGLATPDSDRGRTRLLPWLLAIFAGSVLLRLRHLGIQILGDDEMHLLVVITRWSFTEIPSTVIGFDFSIPLALLFSAWSDFTPLTEIMLRIPVLVCGCCLPVAAVLTARRFVSLNVALLLGMVIAVHPLFIFYSRFVRPYAICALLVIVAIWLIDRWLIERRRRLLAAAVLVSGAAGWFQPLALITLGLIYLGAFLYELAAHRYPPVDDARSRGRPVILLLAAVGALLFFLLLYAPALRESFERVFLAKVGAGTVSWAAVTRNAAVITGLPGTIPTLMFMFLVIVGLFLLARQPQYRALPILVPAIGQPIAIVLLRPELLDDSLVLARYHFYALPFWCLAACIALGATAKGFTDRIAPVLARKRQAGLFCAGLLAGLWVLLGPYPSIYRGDNAYAHNYLFQTFRHWTNPFWQAARARSGEAPIHPFYMEIDEFDEPVPVVVEWPPCMDFTKMTYHVYQAYHGRPMKLLARASEPWWTHHRLALQNVVKLEEAALRSLEPGSIVVLHKNLFNESAWFGLKQALTMRPKPSHVKGLREVSERLTRSLGPPIFEDEYLKVFRLPGP